MTIINQLNDQNLMRYYIIYNICSLPDKEYQQKFAVSSEDSSERKLRNEQSSLETLNSVVIVLHKHVYLVFHLYTFLVADKVAILLRTTY